MALIDRLWSNPIQQEWEKVVREDDGDYWQQPMVKQNLKEEKYFHHLHQEDVEAMDAASWRELLKKYAKWIFPPQFAENNFQPIAALSDNQLLAIKTQLFDFDRKDIKRGLEIIPAWGIPGKSGLLAVLLPEHFGTVGKHVVYSLQHLGLLNPENTEIDEACRLIEIMRIKANQLSEIFGVKDNQSRWTPRRVDMVLWTCGHHPDVAPAKKKEAGIAKPATPA